MNHLTKTTTDRGFTHLPALTTDYGEQVRVYESSAALEPCVWLAIDRPSTVEVPGGTTTAHLSATAAWQLAEQLLTLVRDHYQGDARPEASQRVADLLDAELIGYEQLADSAGD